MKLHHLIGMLVCISTSMSYAQFSGIGVTAPTNTLHIRPLGSADPLRVEGLNDGTAADTKLLVTDPATGVIKLVDRATSSDNQQLTYNAGTNTLTLQRGGTPIVLTNFGDNLGNHTATQNVRLAGNWLSFGATNDGLFIASDGDIGVGTATPATGAKLDVVGRTRTTNFTLTTGAANGRILQSDAAGNAAWVAANTVFTDTNTDNQNLTLSGNNLGINRGTGVSLAAYLDNTDNQNLTLSGNSLGINRGTGVNLAPYLDNTDNQTLNPLSLTGNTLSIGIIRGNTQSIDLSGLADNLGNHNATTRLNMTGHDINFTNGNITFGNSTRQMLNLWGTSYAIGIQGGTQYYRSGANFAWYRGGSHSNGALDAGSGTTAMILDNSSKLTVSGEVQFNNNLRANGAEGVIQTTDEYLRLNPTGDFNFGVYTPGHLEVDGGAIFNEASNSVNFRVESNNDAAALYVNGSTDNVGIGTLAPATSAKLDVRGQTRTTNLQMTSGAATGRILQSDAIGNASWVAPNTVFTNTDNQNLSISSNNLNISGGTGVSLAPYLDNTDNQTLNPLSLSGNTLSIGIIRGNTRTVDLSPLRDNLGNHTATSTLLMNSQDITSSANLRFDGNLRQMIQFFAPIAGIGTQNSTVYTRTPLNLAWYRNGSHSNIDKDPGGGGELIMDVNLDNQLTVNGDLQVDAIVYSDGRRNMMQAAGNSLTLNYDNQFSMGIFSPGHMRIDGAGLFNEMHGDNNFNVKSINDDAAFMVDASTDNVGIGVFFPTAKLDVSGRTKTVDFTMTTGAANNRILRSDGSGNASWVDPNTLVTAPDNQSIQGLILSGTTLTVGIERGSSQTADLSSLADNQSIRNLGLSGTTLTVGIEAGSSQTVSLASLSDDLGSHRLVQNLQTRGNWISNAGGAEGIFMLGGGNVGIGTSSPSADLHVNGNARITALINRTTDNYVVSTDNFGNLRRVSWSDAQNAFSDNLGDHQLDQNLETRNRWLSNDGDNEGIVINADGNVGVGMSPGAQLQVRAGGNNNPTANGIYLYNPDTGGDDDDAIITARVNGANGGDPFVALGVAGGQSWSVGVDNSDDDKFKISNALSDISALTKLTVNRFGEVGIGTTDPQTPLQVFGNNNELTFGRSYISLLEVMRPGIGNGSAAYQYFGRSTTIGNAAAIGYFNRNDNHPDNRLTLGFIGSENIMVIEQSGRVGIGNSNPGFTLHVTGTIHSTGASTSSDSLLKQQILPLGNNLARIAKLAPVSYYWQDSLQSKPGYDSLLQFGLIAQQVKRVMPEAVRGEEGKGLGIDYNKISPAIIGAINELHSEVKALKAVNTKLAEENADLRSVISEVASLRAEVKAIQQTSRR